jgi:hypothetical protein
MKQLPELNPSRNLRVLLCIAGLVTLVHVLTNGRYGWHRDELATLDDARYLAWGYVAYPPVTPFIARLALELFGPSLIGVRLFAALAQAIVIVVAGLMARALGGGSRAQVVAAVAVAICPVALASGALFQYVAFDFLCWVLVAFFTVKLLSTDNPRWWIAIGVAIGIGMMTKYTMAFCVAGLAAGALFMPARQWLRCRWLWIAIGLSFLLLLPNLLWQWKYDFISLQFLTSIHARDVRIGRTDGFLLQQLFIGANPMVIPFWISGLYYYLFSSTGRKYRPIGWMFLIPLLLFIVARGRSYYLAPAYPMLLAAGAVVWERWSAGLSSGKYASTRAATWIALGFGGIFGVVMVLPIAPVHSWVWRVATSVHKDFNEEIGWPELAQTVFTIYSALPDQERQQTRILTGNYGEAGAINLYGSSLGLPEAISGINSYYQRGYGNPPPETVIVLGFSGERLKEIFMEYKLAGQVTNRFGIGNEETSRHPDIFICRHPRLPWPQLWRTLRSFG